MVRTLCSVLFLVCCTVAQAQVLPVFWGLTPTGGANNKGTLFRVNSDGGAFVTVYHFDDLSGYGPEGTLCLASNGKLYGTTNSGGAGSIAAGTLFSYDPQAEVFNKLVDFDLSNGGFGWGGPVAHPNGYIYGATYGGGNGGGSIYRVDPATDTYTIQYGLTQSTDGGGITSQLTLASDGKFYGACAYGGTFNAGTLFRFDPATSTFTKLHDLADGAGGSTPYGSLCDAGNGRFYGTTFEGGNADKGVLFKYVPATNTFTILQHFDGSNGQQPWNAPVVAGPDLLFGVTASGGTNGNGVIYSVVPSTDAVQTRYIFPPLVGGALMGNLLAGDDGLLYGLASFGGTNFQGLFYRFDPATNSVTGLHSFLSALDGATPRGDLVAAGTITGVREAMTEGSFELWPSPSRGVLHIDLGVNWRSGTRVRISDALGATVYEASLVAPRNTLQVDAAPGAYTVSVITAERTSVRRWLLER